LLRLSQAIGTAKQDLVQLMETTKKNIGHDEAAIFEAHLMMLEDPEVIDQTQQIIETEKSNAEYAYNKVTQQFAETMAQMENPYFRERAQDVRDVSQRVLGYLLGLDPKDSFLKKMSSIKESVILVAKDLKPSFTASLDPKRIQGFVVDLGGKTSHTAILARNLEIPAVVGLQKLSDTIKDGDFLAFNGDTGEVWVNPELQQIKQLQLIREQSQKDKQALRVMVGQDSVTLDGHHVELCANIGSSKLLKKRTPMALDYLELNFYS
jgi:phosphotransferase system enzyme I (PtsI)